MHNPRVSIFMAVHNGAAWLPDVLDALRAQTYPKDALEIVAVDNASTDGSAAIVRSQLTTYNLHLKTSSENIGFWAAMEQLFAANDAPYVICLTDVIMHPEFVAEAIRAMEGDPTIGAVQGKVYQMSWTPDGPKKSDRIDTVGFRLERSRRLTILGHGEQDVGQYATQADVFGVEGAIPVFRRTALNDSRIDGHIVDPDYRVGGLGYGDDFDLAWRMTLRGWRQVIVPTALAWHSRSTTTSVEQSGLLAHHVRRLAIRRNIPIEKRRLEWSNIRFTLLKNDHARNLLRDIPAILVHEINVQGYAGLFEWPVLLAWGRLLRLAPRMLRKRRAIMASARVDANHVHALMETGTPRPMLRPTSERWWRLLRAMVVLSGALLCGGILYAAGVSVVHFVVR